MPSLWSDGGYLDLVSEELATSTSAWSDGQHLDLIAIEPLPDTLTAWSEGKWLDLTYVPLPDVSPWSESWYRDLTAQTKTSFAFLSQGELVYLDFTPL
jgi:hypothetical protein